MHIEVIATGLMETWQAVLALAVAFCAAVLAVAKLLVRDVTKDVAAISERLKSKADSESVGNNLKLLRVELEAQIKEVDNARARDTDQLNAKLVGLRNDQRRQEREHDDDIKTIHATFGRGKLYDHDDTPRT